MTLIAEAPPAWALQKYPDSILVRPDGTREPIQENCGMVSVGGYPGFCLDEPQAKELAARFITAAARRYGAHPALAGFALQNEVMPFYSMAQHQMPVNHPCQRPLFQDFLRRRYGTIEHHNAIHQTTLSDFAAAAKDAGVAPAHPTQPPFVVRIGQHGQQRVAFIRNPTGRPQIFRFGSQLRIAAVLDGGTPVAKTVTTLRFAPQETRVLLLKP